MLQFFFLNVKQGNSIVIKLPPEPTRSTPRYGVVDCFYHKGLEEEPQCLKLLKNHDANELEFVILSHHHQDHFLGLGKVLEYFNTNHRRVKKYYEPVICSNLMAHYGSYSQDSDAYNELMTIHECTLGRHNQVRYNALVNATQSINLTDIPNELKATIVTPTGQTWGKFEQRYLTSDRQTYTQRLVDAHILSNALLLTYGRSNILLCGDVTDLELTRALQEFKQSRISLQSDLILVSHHGGSGNPHKLWKATVINKRKRKSMAVISCGYANKYNHPNPQILDRIIRSGARLYCINKGNPCSVFNVTPIQQAINSLTPNNILCDLLTGLQASEIDQICSGMMVMNIDLAGKVNIVYREQNAKCLYK